MKTIGLLFLLVMLPAVMAFGQQGSAIERVDIYGVPDYLLGAGLKGDLKKLEGQTYDPQVVDQLVSRIQTERPDYIAEAKTEPSPQPNRIRLTFVVTLLRDYIAKDNVNTKYVVEAVQIEGVPRDRVSDVLYGEMQSMAGKTFDGAKSNLLASRLSQELRDQFDVGQKVRRGATPGQVLIVFVAERKALNTIFFAPFINVWGYHSRQGFSFKSDLFYYTRRGVGSLGTGLVGHVQNGLEENSGFRGKADIDLPVRGLDLEINYSRLRAQWAPATLAAAGQSNNSPGLYRLRNTLNPSLRFRQSLGSGSDAPSLSLTSGLSFANLEMQSPSTRIERDRSASGGLSFYAGKGSTFSYSVDAGTRTLGSDLVYARHEISASTGFSWGETYSSGGTRAKPHSVSVDATHGFITGNAPMSKRFSMGAGGNLWTIVEPSNRSPESYGLAGWTSSEVAPLGGRYLAHGSVSYMYKLWLGLDYEMGTVWENARGPIRHSVNVSVTPFFWAGSHPKFAKFCGKTLGTFWNPLCQFSEISLSVPLGKGHVRPVFRIEGLKF